MRRQHRAQSYRKQSVSGGAIAWARSARSKLSFASEDDFSVGGNPEPDAGRQEVCRSPCTLNFLKNVRVSVGFGANSDRVSKREC